MSKLVANTISDMRGGRESWRVFSLFTGASFLISMLSAFAQ